MEFDYTKQPGLTRKKEYVQQKSDKVLMSIITPFYNAGRYFEQTFNCVINQTFEWFEWIIVDDGSTNKEDVALLEKLAGNDARIHVYHKENGGPAAARNYAVERTVSDLIVSLDADDLIEPTYLEATYFALYFHPEATWAYTDSLGFENQEYVWKVQFDDEKLKKENFLIEVGTFRKKAFEEIGGYDAAQKHSHEDWNLWLRFMTKGGYPVHISSLLSWYRRVDTGAFHETEDHKQVRENALARVNEIASQITEPITAIEYPRTGEKEKLIPPKACAWDTVKEKKRIEVLMLIPWMEMGGADLFNLEIVKRINKDKYHVGVMTTLAAANELRQKFMEFVDDLYELPSFLDSHDYAEFISYYIKTRQVDVVFVSNSYFGYYLIPWLKKEFPTLKIVDCFHIEEWYWKNGGYARCSKVFEHFVDKTYVSTQHLKDVLIEKFNRKPESIDVVYTGVDEKKFDQTLVEYGSIRQKANIPDDAKVILFVCRIHPQKRPYLMIEIAKRLIERDKSIYFLVVGEGPNLAGIKGKARDYKLSSNMIFYDNQDDLRPFYKDSDIMLLCSIKEGISITTLEACSMGVPVVSSDVGGQAEVIDGHVGAILPMLQDEEADFDSRTFEEQEINQYVTAIENIFADPEKLSEMKIQCRNKIEEKFSTSIMISKFENDFEKYAKNEETGTINYEERYNSLVDDYATIYNELFIYENVAADLWGSMEWLRSFYADNRDKFKNFRHSKVFKILRRMYHFLKRS